MSHTMAAGAGKMNWLTPPVIGIAVGVPVGLACWVLVIYVVRLGFGM